MATTTTSDVPHASTTIPAAAVTTTSADQIPTSSTLGPVEKAAPAVETSTNATAMENLKEHEQTPLTKKFTESEWKALREFRKLLPSALEETYVDSEDKTLHEKPFNLWNVEIDPQHPEKDARVSVILMKFLRARNLNPAEAKAMLVNTLRWRHEFNIAGLKDQKFDPAIFGSLAHIYGKDKEGHPVTYNVYGGNKDIKAVFGDVQQFVRWRVQFMEQSIEQLDLINVDQMIQVHDYEGVSMSSRDANSKNAASECSNIFQSHYPEFLARKFFVNVPSLMSWIFWAFKPFLSSATFAKMSVVGSGPSAIGKAMLPLVNGTELPRKYGGGAEGW